jgi:hypothetical protein
MARVVAVGLPQQVTERDNLRQEALPDEIGNCPLAPLKCAKYSDSVAQALASLGVEVAVRPNEGPCGVGLCRRRVKRFGQAAMEMPGDK